MATGRQQGLVSLTKTSDGQSPPPHTRCRSFKATAASLALLSILTLSSPTLAQQQPIPLGAIAYAVVGNQFVIQGGAVLNDVLNQQFWALDLSSSWAVKSPSWKQLPNGPYNAYHTAIASGDNKTFITFGRDTGAPPAMIPQYFVNVFDFTTNSWTGFTPTGVKDPTRRDFVTVLNPNSQLAYFVGGDIGTDGAKQSAMFDIYDIANKEVTETATPTPGPQGPYTYGAAWLQNHNAMLMVGGQMTPSDFPTTAYLYDAATLTWKTQPTTGDFVLSRISPCVASSADGTKYVAYGGYVNGASGGLADPAVYVLDTTTWVWTKYVQNGRGRGNAACALIDNMFFIWGGYYNIDHNSADATPTTVDALQIFDISTGRWLSNYTPPAWMLNNTTPSPPPPPPKPSPQPSGLSPGAIAGIAAGAAAVIIALVVFAIFRHRSNKRKKNLFKGISSPSPDPRYSYDGSMALNPSGGQSYPNPRLSGGYEQQQHLRQQQRQELQGHHIPERPFDDRPQSMYPNVPSAYYIDQQQQHQREPHDQTRPPSHHPSLPLSHQPHPIGVDPRHSYASSRVRPQSTATFAASSSGIEGYGLHPPLSNQRLSTMTNSTAVGYDQQHLQQLQQQSPPYQQAVVNTSNSSFPTLASRTAVASPESTHDGGYIKPPPPISSLSPRPKHSDQWQVASTSPPLTSTTTESLFKNPQAYPGRQGTVVNMQEKQQQQQPHPYQQQSIAPIAVFSPMSTNSSSTGSSTPLVAGHSTSGSGTPSRSSFSGYHDDTVGFGAVKVPISQVINASVNQPGYGNPQLHTEQIGAISGSDIRRSTNPQGNNGFGATFS